MNSKYPTSALSYIFTKRKPNNLAVIAYDGGTVKKFCLSDVVESSQSTIFPGLILRLVHTNSGDQKYTTQDLPYPPVGIIVSWDDLNNIGSFQYDGVVTLRIPSLSTVNTIRQWDPWYCNDTTKISQSNFPPVGWVLATRNTYLRIQIDIY